jgi:hypothetical protein
LTLINWNWFQMKKHLCLMLMLIVFCPQYRYFVYVHKHFTLRI